MAANSITLLNLSRQYAQAFDLLFPRDKFWAHPSIPMLPAFNALGHSYELVFKSYLLRSGMTEKELRNPDKFGHKLLQLRNEAKARKMLEKCDIQRFPTNDFKLLAQSFENYWTRYADRGGITKLPVPWRLRNTLTRLMDGTDREIRRSHAS